MALRTIGTHDGTFTCNEALACYMLTLLPEYKNARVIRTRDPAVLKTCDIVVSAGDTYSHKYKKYDHNQRSFTDTMHSLDNNHPWTMQLRTAGLIYFHYGRRVLAEIIGKDVSDDLLRRIYNQIYEDFIRAVDGFEKPTNYIHGRENFFRYTTKRTLTARVSYLLPSGDRNTEREQQYMFEKAVKLTGAEFTAKVEYFTSVWWPAMKLAETSTEFEEFPSSRLVHLLQGTPWVDRIFTVDEVIGSLVIRKLYRIAKSLPSDKWRVQLISTKEEMHQAPTPVGSKMQKKIGTHDGTFHCDEALACFMLKQLPEYKDAQVIRTSDPVILKSCDVVVDVGEDYDPARQRYDHHQRGFDKTMHSLDATYPWTTRLSSAGLVYFHYGHRVLAEIMGCDESDDMVQLIFKKFYADFVEAVDGFDNGILPSDVDQLFLITTNLGDRVVDLNLTWDDHYAAGKANDQFRKAMTLAGSEFTEMINGLKTQWWPVRKFVVHAFKTRLQIHESGEVLYLEFGCSWKEHLVDLEMEYSLEDKIKYVLFYDTPMDQYVVQCVPRSLSSRTCRVLLPSDWRGLKGPSLQHVSGVRGSSFVQKAGYVGHGLTYDSVWQMAYKALAMTSRPNTQRQ